MVVGGSFSTRAFSLCYTASISQLLATLSSRNYSSEEKKKSYQISNNSYCIGEWFTLSLSIS